MKHFPYRLSKEVEKAITAGKAIVALETTIISHGMPYPQNFNTALEVESIIKKNGSTPATIGIIQGEIKIGMSEEEIEFFSKSKNIHKVSRRDIPFILSTKKNGATTVAGTMILSDLAGIKLMATGGIGGVHRDANNSFDISADLQELANTNVTVVCSGPKSILDIGLTLEYLETMGVPVIGYKSDFVPTFYSKESKYEVDYNFDQPKEIAQSIAIKDNLSLKGGVLVCNPIPERFSIQSSVIETAIESAMKKAKKHNITGKKLTPFLLDQITNITKGSSLKSNEQLMLNNAYLASKIAISLNKISL